MKGSETGRARARLRIGIATFVLALAVPSALLVLKALDQIKWESFRQQQLSAEEFAKRIDEALNDLVRAEDARPIKDYDFLIETPGKDAAYGRRSPLSELTAGDDVPGLIGWFQVTADGRFSTPLLPESRDLTAASGLTAENLARRQAQADRMKGILIGNRLVERHERPTEPVTAASEPNVPSVASSLTGLNEPPAAAAAPAANRIAMADSAEQRPATSVPAPRAKAGLNERLSQAAFESLAKEQLPPKRSAKYLSDEARRAVRSDSDTLKGVVGGQKARQTPELEPVTPASMAPQTQIRLQRKDGKAQTSTGAGRSVHLFESAIEPCEVGRLDSGHFLLFRSVWRDSTRIIQGALIEQGPFLDRLVGRPFRAATLARTSRLQVVYRGAELASFQATHGRDYRDTASPEPSTLLYRTRLQEPFGGLELVFRADRLPIPPGAMVIAWMAAALALVLLGGAWLMYRLGLSQIALVSQQQDFVSAVSHELKTPLTSIRLYAEMLRAGFATEERKETYYRFIHEESERLSRLIANVLQLARIGRDALVLESRPVAVAELLAAIEERMSGQLERTGFMLDIECGEPEWIQADPDAVIQIFINLVDNALKFCSEAEQRRIRISCERTDRNYLRMSVRDFGPGIAREQRRHLFQLFYRGDDAKRRAIPGTGIGLALVKSLADAMGGNVEVLSREPGAEFRLELPLAKGKRDEIPDEEGQPQS